MSLEAGHGWAAGRLGDVASFDVFVAFSVAFFVALCYVLALSSHKKERQTWQLKAVKRVGSYTSRAKGHPPFEF